MKSKVILFCVLLFCSKFVDSIPHSENHVRQRVNPLSNWQINKNAPNAQYLDTDFTQTRNVNDLPNSVIEQTNNEDYHVNQRGYDYDSYESKGPAPSPSAKELLVNFDSPADGRRLDSYPPRVESYPLHTSQVGFDHQQYGNQNWRSQNLFTNAVPSSGFIQNDQIPLVSSVQEPSRSPVHYKEPKYVPSSNRRFYQPGRLYPTREEFQYPSVDHSNDNKYAVNPASRRGAIGPVPYDFNYSESQASNTKRRLTGVHRHVQNFETPSESIFETPAAESSDTLTDRSENIGFPETYENYSKFQASETKTRPTEVHRHVQNFVVPSEIINETPTVNSPDTLTHQSDNIRLPGSYDNYSESQVSETKTKLTGVRRHVENFETQSEIINETPAMKTPDSLIDQSEHIRFLVPYKKFSGGQAFVIKTKPIGVHTNVQTFENPSGIINETPTVESPDTLTINEGQAFVTKTKPNEVRRHVQNFETPSELINKTPPAESPNTLIDQFVNTRYPVLYESYSEPQASEMKTRQTEVFRHVQNFETPHGIINETPAVESLDTLAITGGQAFVTKTKPTEVSGHVKNLENISEIINKTPAVKSPETLKINEDQAFVTKTRPNGVHRHEQNFVTPPKRIYETSAVESSDSLVGQSEYIRYPVPHEKYIDGQAFVTKTIPTGVRRHVQNFETLSVDSPDTLEINESQAFVTKTKPTEVHRHIQSFETPSVIIDETRPVVEFPETFEISERQAFVTKTNPGLHRYAQNFESTPKLINQPSFEESPNTFANIRTVGNSRLRSHLSDTATTTSHNGGSPVISATDTYKSASRSSNLAPLVDVKNEATVEIKKILPDAPVARQNAYRSNSGRGNIAPDHSDFNLPMLKIETVEIKEGKYGTNYANEKPIPLNIYPKDSPTPTHTILENSGTNTNEKINLPPYGSSSPNNSQQASIYHLTSGIKELSLKNLVANPEIQNILARTNKRFVVVHLNGTIEYLDTLPLDSHQDSNLQLVHTKRQYKDGLENHGVLTPESSEHLSSDVAKYPAPIDEYPRPTNNQTADVYYSNPVAIPFKNLPAVHSHLPVVEQPANNENLKPAVNQSVRIDNLKPLIQNDDQPLDRSRSKPISTPLVNQPEDYTNLKLLIPNEVQLVSDARPKPQSSPDSQVGDDDNSKLLPHDVKQPTDDSILKHLTFPENQQRDHDISKLLLIERNQSNDKLNLTQHANNAKTENETSLSIQLENDDSSRPSLLTENQSSNDNDSKRLPSKKKQPERRNKSKHSNANELAKDNDSKPASSEEFQLAKENGSNPLPRDDDNIKLLPHDVKEPTHDNILKHLISPVNQEKDADNLKPKLTEGNLSKDKINFTPHARKSVHIKRHTAPNIPHGNQLESELLPWDENPSGDDLDSNRLRPNLIHPVHHIKKKTRNQPEDSDKSNPSSPIVNQPIDDDVSPEPQPGDKNFKTMSTQTTLAKEGTPKNENGTSPDKQLDDDDRSKPLLSTKNQSANDNDSKLQPSNQKQPAQHYKSKHSDVNKSENDNNSNPSSSEEYELAKDNGSNPLPRDDDNTKLLPHDVTEPTHDSILKHLISPVNQQKDDDNLKRKLTEGNLSKENINLTPHARKPVHIKRHTVPKNPRGNQLEIEPFPWDDNPSGDDLDSNRLHLNSIHPVHHIKKKSRNQPEDGDKSNQSSPFVNQPIDDDVSPEPQPGDKNFKTLSTQTTLAKEGTPKNENGTSPDKQLENDDRSKPLLSIKNQSANDNDSKLQLSKQKQLAQRNKSKHSDVNKSENDNYSNPSSSEEYELAKENASKPLTRDDDKTKLLPHNAKQPTDDSFPKNFTFLENHQRDDDISKLSLTERNQSNSKINLTPHGNQPENEPLPWDENLSVEDGGKTNPSSPVVNPPEDDGTPNSLLSNKTSVEKQLEDEVSSKPSLLPEYQSVDDNNYKRLPSKKKRPARRNKPKHSNDNKPAKDYNTNPASLKEHKLAEDNGFKSLPRKKPRHSTVNQKRDDGNSNPSFQDENQPRDGNAANLLNFDENESRVETVSPPLTKQKQQRENHKKLKHTHRNKSTLKELHPSENPSTDDNNSKPSPKEENQPDNETKPLPSFGHKSTDNLNIKPTPFGSSKNDDDDKSTTLSPTVSKHITTSNPKTKKTHKRKHRHHKYATNLPVVSTTSSPDDYSEDQIITLSPIEQKTDNVSDGPTLITTTTEPVESSDKRVTNEDKAKVQSEENEDANNEASNENNGEDTQIAVYNSSELLDTNTDVPEENDDYLPVTMSPSIQNDVNSGENSSELEQCETDITVSVSSSTANDSEDEIITINIEVSESTVSPSIDKSLVVSIDTVPDNDDSETFQTDVSKTTKTENCEWDDIDDDDRGRNVEIDLSNLKGEPTVWIRTSNQDFIDKLRAKDDTDFDLVYFYSVDNKPTIEREKETTIFCNGTVIIENTEITYAHEDDQAPTIVKTKEIMQIEDYEADAAH